MELEVRERFANNTAGSGLGPWYLAKAKALSGGLSNAYFKSLGLPSLWEDCRRNFLNRPIRTVRMVVWEGSAGDCRSYADHRPQS